MIVCDKTIEILNSFSAINQSMILDWDGTISVISPQGNMFAMANVPEKYEKKWAIYNIPQMVGIIKLLFNDPQATAECYDDHVIFKNGNMTVKYRFVEESLVKKVPETVKTSQLINVYAECTLQWNQLQNLIKSASLLQNTHIKVELDFYTQELKFSTLNSGNPSTSKFEQTVSALINNSDEPSLYNISMFNILKNNYKIQIAKKCLYLESEDGNIKYWIGREKE